MKFNLVDINKEVPLSAQDEEKYLANSGYITLSWHSNFLGSCTSYVQQNDYYS